MTVWKVKVSQARRAVLAAAVFFACGAAGAVHAEAGRGTIPGEVESQYVSVTLDPEHHRLRGESTLFFSPGTTEVSLRLAENATIAFVEAGADRREFSFRDGIISFRLPASREPAQVLIAYSAEFNDTVSQHPAGEDPSYGVSGAITREGTFLGDGAYWYPVPSSVPHRRSLSVTAPLGTESISYGRRVSRETVGARTSSVWEEARPVGALSLCAGPYQIQERRVNGIDIYSYLYPDNAALAPRYLDAAAKYIAFYSKLFGPFPFEKFAVVENFFPTGYGFPSFTLLGGSVIRLPFIVDTSFPHEIAHSWWGNGIEADSREGNWSEGLVTYLADYLLKERRSPAEGRDYRRQLLIDYSTLVTPANDFPLTSFQSRSDPSSRAIGYGKGAMLFHMVRKKIGDGPFFDALRQVCREHMYGTASWTDFIRAFSRSGRQDIEPFMRQFLSRTGGPRLSLGEAASEPSDKGWKVTGSIHQQAPPYSITVPVRLKGAGSPRNDAVAVMGERTPFSVVDATRPDWLLLDPDADVFRILSAGEIPATVNSIKGSSTLIGVVSADCHAAPDIFKYLLASLSQERAPILREEQLNRQEIGGHDLIFCGVPRDRSLVPPLPDGIAISGGSLSVEGKSWQEPDALLMAVMRRPQ
ncbi:M1 family metallopeptidase, partial [Geomonas sp.]|uniref:M1 family metallopeptidase n=1 Tax=Geomonas sp. TaxID=2651584 RepID=UPI002B46677F